MNVNYSFYGNQVFGTLGWILCGVSVLTSTAISVDRLLTLLLGLRYRHVVTLRRVRVVIICFWLISASAGSIWILRNDIAYTLASVLLTLCLITSIFCYTRIHIKLQNIVPQGQPNGGETPLNIARYKKTVSTSATSLYFSSSLNPILYCWKIREVKQAVKQLKCF